MIGLVLAAPRSGSGKTTLAVALLALLQRRGLHPCAFKCGPDYIDPGFHRAVLGVECRNLDLYLSEPETVKALFARGCCGCGADASVGAGADRPEKRSVLTGRRDRYEETTDHRRGGRSGSGRGPHPRA